MISGIPHFPPIWILNSKNLQALPRQRLARESVLCSGLAPTKAACSALAGDVGDVGDVTGLGRAAVLRMTF
jgi:hypothetical protein